MWFERLTGFSEESPQQVREHLVVDVQTMVSHANGRAFRYGRLETPTLADLRERVGAQDYPRGQLVVREVVADVQRLHLDVDNTGALFQVASQFNLLEMVSPNVTPEQGIGIYEHDHTQGPACAIAAGAGTIYRNYFVEVNGQIGQSADNQIDCLADIGAALGNVENRLWTMKNGYALPSQRGLAEIAQRLGPASESERDEVRRLLRIGALWNTQVTLGDAQHTVAQAYCSAMPVAYSPHPPHLWEPFARLVLEAAYEATICTALLNAVEHGNNRLYLTLLGGGVFGNRTTWIIDAIDRAMNRYNDAALDVAIVSYGTSNRHIQQLVRH